MKNYCFWCIGIHKTPVVCLEETAWRRMVMAVERGVVRNVATGVLGISEEDI